MPNGTSGQIKRFMILISEEKLQSYSNNKRIRIIRHNLFAGEHLTTIDGEADLIAREIPKERIIFSRDLSEEEINDFHNSI